MSYRISPLWWPVLALFSPILLPYLLVKNIRFRKNLQKSLEVNRERIEGAETLELPQLDHFELTVLVEHKTSPGFLGSPGVSYFIKTEQGSLLFDIGFGKETPALSENAGKLGFTIKDANALLISHLHPDHMGGFKAVRKMHITLPEEMGAASGQPCFMPGEADAEGFRAELVTKPRLLVAGIASTGPLVRSLFLMGWTEEQAIVARLKDKGLVVFTGCGHPTIETILQMVRQISDEPIYAVGGGLHFPITDSPFKKLGIKAQMIWGTGKPPWQRLTDEDLTRTIENLNAVAPRHVLLSAHDTCDHAIDRFRNELEAEVDVLKAGGTYVL